jgi:hypothetical protein
MRTRDCSSKRIRKDYLENYVLDVVEQDIFAPEKLPVLARMMLARARERDKEIIQEEETRPCRIGANRNEDRKPYSSN